MGRKLRYKTIRTKKTKGHDHVALVDAKGDGKTLASNRDHVHPVKSFVVVEKKDHTHPMK